MAAAGHEVLLARQLSREQEDVDRDEEEEPHPAQRATHEGAEQQKPRLNGEDQRGIGEAVEQEGG